MAALWPEALLRWLHCLFCLDVATESRCGLHGIMPDQEEGMEAADPWNTDSNLEEYLGVAPSTLSRIFDSGLDRGGAKYCPA